MNEKLNLFRDMKASLEGHCPATLVTVIDGPEAGKKFLLDETGQVTRGEAPMDFSSEGIPLKKVFKQGENQYFAQLAEKDPDVLVLGAGHVSRSISDILTFIGCNVTVADDRPEYLRDDFFGATVHKEVIDFENLATLPLDTYNGIIIVTRAHEFDSICLRQLRPYLDTYMGIMGSSKRIHHVRVALAESGWSQEEINKLYGPIGLDLGADTPEEIALSIVSEYLSVVRGKWPVIPLKHKSYEV